MGNMNLKMYDLLVEKYDIWEIGSEDENIFYHEFNEKVNELLIKYVPKIESYIASFKDLLQRKINLSQGGSTTNYLYPVSTQSGKVSNEVRYDGNKDSLLLIFKSNAELLTQVMKQSIPLCASLSSRYVLRWRMLTLSCSVTAPFSSI